jgi:hypothetical protein
MDELREERDRWADFIETEGLWDVLVAAALLAFLIWAGIA